MRFGAWFVFALLLGAFVANFVLEDRGYVLVNFRGYVLEMSVPGLLLVLVGAYIAVRAAVAVWTAPRRFRAAAMERRVARSGTDLIAGLTNLVEGNWARSERLLTHGLRHGDAPLVNCLLAARAAQAQGAIERRDEWLKLAYDATPEGAASVVLTQAELELEAAQPAAALATLARLEEHKADQPAALALLVRAYRALERRDELIALLPRLPVALLPREERDALAVYAMRDALERPGLDEPALARLWTALPSELRMLPAIIALRARALDRLGRGDDAESELRTVLKHNWQPALVASYGEVRSKDLAKQLRQVETWLSSYPDDAALLLAAARLCMAQDLWGKARSYLESSVALVPAPEAYAAYGKLLADLGESEGALLAFRSGLALVSSARAELTPPARALAAPARSAARDGR
jgi:HemY protein